MSSRQMPEYRAWKAMKARCYSPCNAHLSYQRNGIQVCERWRSSFPTFLADMGLRPSEHHTLDRIDNSHDYSAENCRWATMATQCANRGNFNKVFEHDGRSMILKDWARELGINYTTLYSRIYRNGLSFEDAILQDPFHRQVAINSESMTVREWCAKLNRNPSTVIGRIHEGWNKSRAITTPTPKPFSA